MHADAWSAVGSVGSAGVLVAAAFYASRQVKEARKLREEQARPWVFVSFEVTGGVLISLVIENFGRSVARDVSFVFDPPLAAKDTFAPEAAPAVVDGIPTFPPGHALKLNFDTWALRKESGLPNRYDVVATYSDTFGKKLKPDKFVLDLAPHFADQVKPPTVERSLAEIEKHLRPS